MTSTALVETLGLVKSYRRGPETVHALVDVSFSLRPAELVALVGPSGSGKTTLLNVMAGWEVADSGSLLWEGGSFDPARLPWSDLAVVPQRLGLLDELSLAENVGLPLRLGAQGVDPLRANELLRQLGLIELGQRRPSETSLGEQQRTALARALVLTPRLLLADEPVGHQDEASAERVFAALQDATARGTCCLVATHSRATLRFCDRALRVDDGRVEPLPLATPRRGPGRFLEGDLDRAREV
ncbi:MAG: ABC transporter ATP-binding protein [Actinomycetota bacterium]